MKKFISLMIVLAMCFSMTVSYAADTPLATAIKNATGVAIDEIKDMPVNSDIKVSSDNGVTYVNGPISMQLTPAKAAEFGFEASIDMSGVKELFTLYKGVADAVVFADSSLQEEYDRCYVTGEFTINVDYPATGFVLGNPAISSYAELPGFTSLETGTDMREIFEEVSRGPSTSPYSGYNRLQIIIKVKESADPAQRIGISTLATHLSDLKLTYTGNKVTQKNETGYTIRGSWEGHTTIHSDYPQNGGVLGRATYYSQQKLDGENDANYRDPADDISATIIVTEDGTPGTSLGGGSVTYKTLTIMDGEEELSKKQYITGTTIETGKLDMPKKDGCVFAGYYYDKELTQPVEENFKLTEDKVIYVKWKDCVLNDEKHFAYIIGYPMENGREEVRPENNMTREEIATVFYRLLKDDVRDELFATTNQFPDVEDDRWSNKAISTVANGGYVNGYEDGTFKPANPITRAEFVTIATRFYAVDEVYTQDVNFTDVSGHWAEKYIKYATASGWIDGYEDGTFKPNKYITRAEVMKIINHMLGRAVNEEGLVSDAKRWIDNSPDKWYYYEVIEATNFHSYDKAQGAEFEKWTAILENEILIDKPEYEDA